MSGRFGLEVVLGSSGVCHILELYGFKFRAFWPLLLVWPIMIRLVKMKIKLIDLQLENML